MKSKLALVMMMMVLTPFLAMAENAAPKYLNIQAVLTDNGGNVLYDLQESDITFQIIDGSGEVYYTEVQNVPIVNGMMSVLVGQGTDPTTGQATGGIPYDVLSPDGDRLIRFKLADDSIPQEDVSIASAPYSYYAQYAIDLPTDTVTTDHILNGTITQDDFSQELIDYIDSSMTGISEQDLLDHKSEEGAHTARSISMENNFVNISGDDLQTAIEAIDAQLNLRTSVIDDETAAREAADITLQQNIDSEATTRADADTTLQSNIDVEESAREAADEALDARVDTLETTATSLQDQIDAEESAREAADTALQNDIDTHESTDINDAHPGEITSVTIQDGTITTSDMFTTNISQWTNDSGFITDGNTNWNNEYEFITASDLPDFSTWDQDASNDLTTTTSFGSNGGDVTGTYDNLEVSLTPDEVGASPTGHDHDGDYAPIDHTHPSDAPDVTSVVSGTWRPSSCSDTETITIETGTCTNCAATGGTNYTGSITPAGVYLVNLGVVKDVASLDALNLTVSHQILVDVDRANQSFSTQLYMEASGSANCSDFYTSYTVYRMTF